MLVQAPILTPVTFHPLDLVTEEYDKTLSTALHMRIENKEKKGSSEGSSARLRNKYTLSS